MLVGNDLGNPEIVQQHTFWELAAQSLWGTYISEIEKDAILRAHNIAGKPSRALEIDVKEDVGRNSFQTSTGK